MQNTAMSSRSRSASIVAPSGSTAILSTADFDPAANNPHSTALPAVESII